MGFGLFQRRRGIVRAVGAGVVAALVAAGCSGSGGGSSSGGGGSSSDRGIIILKQLDLNTLDPHRMWCDTCQVVISGVYERLVNVDPADPKTLLPGLASEWSANADSTEFTFKLNPKATFADGTPVTSADVKWSFERSANIKAGGSFLLAGLAEVDTPDPQTAVVKFENPNSPFLKIAGAALAVNIANSKLLTEQAKAKSGPGADTDEAESWFASGRSAGSGPYTIESYSAKQSIVLKRNDNYWDTKAPFASITIQNADDSASQVLALQNGDVDIAMNVSFDSLDQVKAIKGVTAVTLDSYNFIHLNLNKYAPGGEDLSDVRVRQAIRYAIDYDKLIQTTLAGNGKVQAAPIPNGFPGTEGLELPKRDLAKAKQLMADAGKSAGFSITGEYFTLNIYGVDLGTLMQRIQTDLKDINIDVKLEPVDSTKWVNDTEATGIAFTPIYFSPDYIDAAEYIQYFGPVSTSNRGFGPPTPGATYDNDPEADALIAKALATSDDAARAKIYNQLGQKMIDDAEVIALMNPKSLIVAKTELAPKYLSPCCVLDLALLGR